MLAYFCSLMLRKWMWFETKSLGDRVSMATKMAELFRSVPGGKAVGVFLMRAKAKIEPAANIKRSGQAFNFRLFGRWGRSRSGGGRGRGGGEACGYLAEAEAWSEEAERGQQLGKGWSCGEGEGGAASG